MCATMFTPFNHFFVQISLISKEINRLAIVDIDRIPLSQYLRKRYSEDLYNTSTEKTLNQKSP